MNGLVKQCYSNWEYGKCRLSDDIKGWGCKLLTCLPEEIPTSIYEKAKLFARVYGMAKNMGITECSHFREACIDETLDDDKMLKDMVLVNMPTRADLLSEEMEMFYNYL